MKPFTVSDLARPDPIQQTLESSIAKGTMTTFRANVTTGPYGIQGPTSETKAKMRKDPDLGMALAMLAAPIKSCPWTIQSDDPGASAFLTEALKPIMPHVLACMEDALAEGWQGFEKIYEVRKLQVADTTYSNAVVYQELLDLPQSLSSLKIENGDLVGIQIGKAVIDVTPGEIDKGLVVTMPRQKWLSFNGAGRLDAAYDDWYALKNILQFLFMHIERTGDPPVKGRAPAGTSYDPATQATVDNMDMVLQMGRLLKGRGTIALPGDTDEKGNYLWDLNFIDTKFATAPWLQVITLLIARVMRAFFQPEKRIMEGGSVGSWASLKEQSEAVELIVLAYMDELGQQLTSSLLPPLIKLNLPEGTQARVVFGAADRASMDTLKAILDKAFQVSETNPALQNIDLRAVLTALNVPMVSEEERELALTKALNDLQLKATQDQGTKTQAASPGQGQAIDAALHTPPAPSPTLPRFDLAKNKALSKEFRKKLTAMAADWKPKADKILKDQVKELISKVQDILTRVSDPVQQMREIKDLTVSGAPYKAALEEFLKEAQAFGRASIAVETGKQAGLPTAYDAVRASVLADGLAADRVAALEKIVNVTSLNAVHWGSDMKDVAYQIEERAGRILGELSNEVTAVAEAWRGFSDGRQSVVAELMEDGGDDGIVGAVFHAAEGSCELCSYLDGQAIKASHPDFWSLQPPHHHNCQCQMEYLTQQEMDELDPDPFAKPPQKLLERADWYFTPGETL